MCHKCEKNFEERKTLENHPEDKPGIGSVANLRKDQLHVMVSIVNILTRMTNNAHGGIAVRGELLLLRMPQPQMEARV